MRVLACMCKLVRNLWEAVSGQHVPGGMHSLRSVPHCVARHKARAACVIKRGSKVVWQSDSCGGGQSQQVNVGRVYVGTFCTSLDMAGFSLTLQRLTSARRARLDAPAQVCNLYCSGLAPSWSILWWNIADHAILLARLSVDKPQAWQFPGYVPVSACKTGNVHTSLSPVFALDFSGRASCCMALCSCLCQS